MMGKIANQYCDKIYLTDDNPRFENPKTIRNSIKKNINKSKIYEISNRANAIKKAIFDLKTGDILLLQVKGMKKFKNTKKLKNYFLTNNKY